MGSEKISAHYLYLQECKAISQQMIGSETALPLEDYIRIYHDTGVDIDGRLHHIRHRVTSYASRLVTYMKFMSTIPGFLNLPEVDRDALASGELRSRSIPSRQIAKITQKLMAIRFPN